MSVGVSIVSSKFQRVINRALTTPVRGLPPALRPALKLLVAPLPRAENHESGAHKKHDGGDKADALADGEGVEPEDEAGDHLALTIRISSGSIAAFVACGSPALASTLPNARPMQM